MMDIEMKVQILRACSSKKGNRCSSCPAFGHGDRNCIRNAMKDAATALTALLAENEKLRTELERMHESLDFARTKDDESVRLGLELEVRKRQEEAMTDIANDFQQQLHAALDELEQVKQKYGEAREAICTHCMDVPCQGESCYWWQGPEEET